MIRIGLLGAVGSTEAALQGLVEAGHSPAVVLTLPRDQAARHSDFVDLRPMAARAGAPVAEVSDVNDDDILSMLQSLELDLLMVIGWSRMCGPRFRATARLGALGYHPTLLPAMRGRAALAWTLLLDVRRTGGTLFWLTDEVDAGDIAAQRAFDLAGTERLQDLMDSQYGVLAQMVAELAVQLEGGERPARPQQHEDATYVAHRTPDDGRIDWSSSAIDIERLVRAVSAPYPGAFTFWRGERLIVHAAAVTARPDWHAQVGQVFAYARAHPIVRCGSGDLVLLDYDTADKRVLRGQPRLGIT